MSASPVPQPTAQVQKRPLEDPSSETGFDEGHNAKRPALEKQGEVNGSEEHVEPSTEDNKVENGTLSPVPEPAATDALPAPAIKDENIIKDESPSAESQPTDPTLPPQNDVLQTQPIQSTTSANGISRGSPFPNQNVDESGWLHVRSVISSAEAATVIGKGGENVTLIRRMSGAKCTVSDYSRGAVERVLTVSGLADAVAKVSRKRNV